MNKPKLLLVADTYYPKVDGTLRFMEEFLKRSKSNFDVSLLVPNFGKKKNKRVNYLKVYKRIQLSGYPSIKLSFSNLKLIKNSIKEADIIFIQGPALASYLSIYYAHKYHKKVIFYTHTLSWEIFAKFLPTFLNRLFSGLVKNSSIYLYNRCSAVLVPYHGLKEQLEKEGVNSRLLVARLGVDIVKFCPTKDKRASKVKIGLDPNKMVIGYVGRISKEKNTSVLLKAFSRLPQQENLFLLMVGNGPENQTSEFKNIKNSQITGFVYNVQDYLKAMDLFVMPSLTETTSLATLEAMSCGLPVIATKVGFIQNYIVRNHNGTFFPAHNYGLLTMKLEKLLNNPELRERLGYNAC